MEEAVNADKVAEVGHSMHQPASVQSGTFPLSFSARIQTWAALGKRAAGDRGVGWASHSCVLVRTHFYIFTLPFHHLLWPHEARVNLEARFDPSSHFLEMQYVFLLLTEAIRFHGCLSVCHQGSIPSSCLPSSPVGCPSPSSGSWVGSDVSQLEMLLLDSRLRC